TNSVRYIPWIRRGLFVAEARDGSPKPVLYCIFQLLPVTAAFERVYRVTLFVQRYEMAGQVFVLVLGGHGKQQHTVFVAFRLVPRNEPVVDTRDAVIEERRFLPGLAGGAGIASPFDQVELGFQQPYQLGMS